MTKHLANCPALKAENANGEQASVGKQKVQPARLFHLLVEGRGATMYWLHLEMSVDATLTQLDSFLSDQWLECCGHLSAFEINGQSYASSVNREWGMDDKSMRSVKLGKVLSIGQQFGHEYDFGTTTELNLKVLGERVGMATKSQPVRLLAQNDPPEIPCSKCGKLATQLCTECLYEDQDEAAGWLCDDCVEQHECDEEMLLPVVNSPRVGMCGYTG